MSTDTAPIYVIGHKNPDTDSICSAIAYAELKNLLHGGGYVAARAGQINQETQYVMNFFQTQPPIYVSDVMTDVSDIEIRKTQGVSGQISLKKAWNMMRALGVVTLPITDNQRLQGLITIGDIANAYMDVYDNWEYNMRSPAPASHIPPYGRMLRSIHRSHTGSISFPNKTEAPAPRRYRSP